MRGEADDSLPKALATDEATRTSMACRRSWPPGTAFLSFVLCLGGSEGGDGTKPLKPQSVLRFWGTNFGKEAGSGLFHADSQVARLDSITSSFLASGLSVEVVFKLKVEV